MLLQVVAMAMSVSEIWKVMRKYAVVHHEMLLMATLVFSDLKKFCEKDYMQMACQDLACQLVNDHPYINVIVGGGQKNFYSKDQKLPANESQFGVRLDGRNLVNEWIKKREAVGEKFCLIRKPNELVDCDANQADFILGMISNI